MSDSTADLLLKTIELGNKNKSGIIKLKRGMEELAARVTTREQRADQLTERVASVESLFETFANEMRDRQRGSVSQIEKAAGVESLAEIKGVAAQNLTDMAAAVVDVQQRLGELREEIRKVNLGAGALADTKMKSMIEQTAHELMRLREETMNCLQGIRNRASAADADVSRMAAEMEKRIADGVAQAGKQLSDSNPS